MLQIVDTSITYKRTQMVRAALPWRWRGVLHEFLSCVDARTSGLLECVRLRRNHDGARRRHGGTYIWDAQLLETALATEHDPFMRSRYQFYLAQSYRDCGEKEKALQAYLQRAELGFWIEEVFVSLYAAAKLKESLGHSVEQVIATFQRASEVAPSRAEALHAASRLCRENKKFAEGYEYARRGLAIPLPPDGLFVAPWVYDYGLLDEFAVNAYWTERYQDCLEACHRLLREGKLPQNMHDRVKKNAEFATERLKPSDLLSRPVSQSKTMDHLGAANQQSPMLVAENINSQNICSHSATESNAMPLLAGTTAQTLSRPKIAIYAIALNEAQHVKRWCSSAADADYLIVTDTGSTDETVALLTAAGVHKIQQIAIRPWRFDDARNISLASVPVDVDICISLDMDEFMMPGWRAMVEGAWTLGTTRLSYNFAPRYERSAQTHPAIRKSKIHSRWGYRWKRIVHEDLVRTESNERLSYLDALLIGQIQDPSKSRSNYLFMLEQACKEDPNDSQICFWLARDLMYTGQNEQSAEKYITYLGLPTSTWADERAEAMRFLARVQPKRKHDWLQKAVAEAPYRRELWLDLSEVYHAERNWLQLFWACMNGIENTRRTGSYLDDPAAWNFRMYDLAALACSRLGLIDRAVQWGAMALEHAPGDERLANNLTYYRSQAK